MKNFLLLLRMDMNRAILSVNFILSTLFISLIMIVSCSGFLTKSSEDIVSMLEHALSGSGSPMIIFSILPILPYGMSFALDMEEKASTFWVIRTGSREYAVSKYIAAIISGFLTITVGIFVFALILSLFFPLFENNNNGNSYAVFLVNNKVGIYLLLYTIHNSLSGALFAGVAMTVSSYIPNKFTVLTIPIVVYFVLMRITTRASIPIFLKVDKLVQSIYPDVSPMTAFMYKLIPVTIILGILLSVTAKQVVRKLEVS